VVRQIALVFCLALLCGQSTPHALAQDATSATLRIGLSLPLSGTSAILANQFRQGAELAVELLAPQGIELFVADDGCDKDLAELAAADLRADGVHFVTGLLCNEAADAAAKAFAGSQVPVLVAGARSSRILRDAARNKSPVWRLAPSDHEPAKAAFDILSKRWATKPWAIVDDGTVGSRALADEFRALMEEANLPPVASETYRPAQTSFSALMKRLERAGVAGVFVPGSAEDVANIAASGQRSGLAIDWVGGPELDALPAIAEPATAPEGLLAILPVDPLRQPAAGALEGELVSRNIDPEPYVVLGYAATSIAIAAVSQSVDEARTKLSGTRFSTVLGPVSFATDGASDYQPFALHEWRGGAFVPVATAGQ
jgi:branched-chain amino acid transport system substrate-binding protein